jgi:hypothetical protein
MLAGKITRKLLHHPGALATLAAQREIAIWSSYAKLEPPNSLGYRVKARDKFLFSASMLALALEN